MRASGASSACCASSARLSAISSSTCATPPTRGSRVLLKLEYFAPGASTNDRFAKQIIEDAANDGRLVRGGTIVELTSGSAGIVAGYATGANVPAALHLAAERSTETLAVTIAPDTGMKYLTTDLYDRPDAPV